eukprot:scaffold1672_cov75-Phaeocystis_antarctica.AAC.6
MQFCSVPFLLCEPLLCPARALGMAGAIPVCSQLGGRQLDVLQHAEAAAVDRVQVLSRLVDQPLHQLEVPVLRRRKERRHAAPQRLVRCGRVGAVPQQRARYLEPARIACPSDG